MLRVLVTLLFLGVWFVPSKAHADDSDTIVVHIASPETVVLERYSKAREGAWQEPWEVVCTSPCDEVLSVDAIYRINGAGVRASSAFHLPSTADGHATLRVDPAHTGSAVASVGGMLAGVALSIAGVAVLSVDKVGVTCRGLGNSSDDAACEQRVRDESSPISPTVGALFVAGGAALLVTSTVLLATTGTDVEGTRESSRAPRDAYLRKPEFRGAGWQPPAPTVSAPVLSFSF